MILIIITIIIIVIIIICFSLNDYGYLFLYSECVCVSRRLYGIKCAKCNIGFSKNDFVMRARSKVYHIECFRCVACSRQLIPGDEFALREDGLFCRADHDVVERASLGSGDPLSPLHPARPLQMAGRSSLEFRGRFVFSSCFNLILGPSFLSLSKMTSARFDEVLCMTANKRSFVWEFKVL